VSDRLSAGLAGFNGEVSRLTLSFLVLALGRDAAGVAAVRLELHETLDAFLDRGESVMRRELVVLARKPGWRP
jgi:hypothetical protein